MTNHSAGSTVAVLLILLIWCLLLHFSLALWVNCGKPCGASGKTTQTETDATHKEKKS